METVTVEVSSEQIRALYSDPVTIIPSPGPGAMLIPTVALIAYGAGQSPYATNTSLLLTLGPSDTGGQISGVIDQTQDTIFPRDVFAHIEGAAYAFDALTDKPLLLTVADGGSDPQDGNGTLTVTVEYLTADVS